MHRMAQTMRAVHNHVQQCCHAARELGLLLWAGADFCSSVHDVCIVGLQYCVCSAFLPYNDQPTLQPLTSPSLSFPFLSRASGSSMGGRSLPGRSSVALMEGQVLWSLFCLHACLLHTLISHFLRSKPHSTQCMPFSCVLPLLL